MSPEDDVVQIEGLTKRFKNVAALEEVSFTLPRGSGFFLLGPNGSGKTTLLRLLTGVQRPTDGTVHVLGEDPYRRPDRLARWIGVAYENHHLPPWASARAYLRFAALTRGLPEDTIDTAGALFQLRGYWDREMGTYSAGMRKRVTLAQAWLGDPQLLLLDEPFSSLDPEGRRLLAGLLRARQADGLTTLVATHLAETMAPPTHLALLLNGVLEAIGPIGSLADRYGARATALSVPDVAEAMRVLLAAGARSLTAGEDRVVVQGDSDVVSQAVDALGAAGMPAEVTEETFDIWAIFRQVLAGAPTQEAGTMGD